MNQDSTSPVASAPSENLADALLTLRLQLQATLIILIMISGALNLYLLRQYTTLRKEVAALEPQVGQMIADYQQVTIPLVNKFLSQLTDYAKTHPDFQPILTKYRIQPVPATGAVAGAAQATGVTSTAPAKAASPKASAPPAKPKK